MSSYLSSLLTTTSSRVRGLIPSNSETDGDTEDDTHVCRVLRAYYVEKGRPFPAWLPPDPKAPPPVAPAMTVAPYPPVGAGYGGLPSNRILASGMGQSKLGSLWASQPAVEPPSQPQSLRAGRGGASQALRAGEDPYGRNNRTPEPTAQVQARPLPSQRVGSVQQSPGITPPGSAGAGNAQDRLKARLWGAARQRTPGLGDQSSSASVLSVRSAGAEKSYPGSGGYDDRSSNFGAGSSRDSPGGNEKPFIAATSPWANSADAFPGAGYGGGGNGAGYNDAPAGPPARRIGLPSGPKGGGLPGGPRSKR